MTRIVEDSRSSLINKSKRSDNYDADNRQFGKNRHQRRLKSKIARSVAEYNNIDMNKVFKEDILDVYIRIHGETNTYLVQVSFAGFLNSLAGFLRPDATEEDINFKLVLKSLLDAFNHNDVMVHCSCPDFQYREAYWATINGINAGPAETRPSDETNPNDTKGLCKHINLVLNNNSWMMKVASVIHNYINYMKEHFPDLYQKVIYPAIFDTEYIPPEEPEDNEMDELEAEFDDELMSDEDTIDTSNKWAKTKNQFKPGNKSGMRFTSDNKNFDVDSVDSEENIDDIDNIEED